MFSELTLCCWVTQMVSRFPGCDEEATLYMQKGGEQIYDNSLLSCITRSGELRQQTILSLNAYSKWRFSFIIYSIFQLRTNCSNLFTSKDCFLRYILQKILCLANRMLLAYSTSRQADIYRLIQLLHFSTTELSEESKRKLYKNKSMLL